MVFFLEHVCFVSELYFNELFGDWMIFFSSHKLSAGRLIHSTDSEVLQDIFSF